MPDYLAGDVLAFNAANYAVASTTAGGALPNPVLDFVSGVIAGPMTNTQPVDEIPVNYAGVMAGGVNDALYGKVYVSPGALDLGNVITNQARTITLWNAQLTNVTVQSVSLANGEGISITAPATPPFTFYGAQEINYTVAVDVSGPPSIAADITFVISSLVYDVLITGSRVSLWPFPPNWSSPVMETLEWNTKVIRAFDGHTQTRSLRSRPRRELSYDFLLQGSDTQWFDSVTWGWQNRAYAVPVWQYKARTTASISASATSIPVNTVNGGFEDGQLAVVYVSPDSYEVVEIQTVGAGALTLLRPTAQAWPANTAIYPALVSFVNGGIPTAWLTANALRGRVAFRASPIDATVYLPTATAPVTYNGYEVLMTRNNWKGGASVDYGYDKQLTEFLSGPFELMVTETAPQRRRKFSWLLKTRQEVADFRAFLKRIRGAAVPFYVPTWTQDITVTAPISASAVSMTCVDRGHGLLVGTDGSRGHLLIRTTSGATFFRPIQSMGAAAGVLSVNFTTALGVLLNPSDIAGVHFLDLCRLSADKVEIEWVTDRVATVSTYFEMENQT